MSKMKKILATALSSTLLFSNVTMIQAAPSDNVEGTKLIIGQTFQQEFEDYVAGIGVAPVGGSHYGEIFSGTLNQGDDGKYFDDSAPFLDYVADTYPGSTELIAISIKDNPGAGGYGNLLEDPSGIYKAVKDIAYTDKWDDEIRGFADKFKEYPDTTFLVRLGYEVNMLMMANASGLEYTQVLDKYNEQGVNINDDISLADPSDIDVKAYHDAYNKMAMMIREEEGASNVKFVYHPVRGFGEVKALYPGDEYVDYIGFSVFNHDVSMGTDETGNEFVRTLGYDGSTIDSNLEQSLEWASAKKPIIIAEAAYQKAPDEWIDNVDSPHDKAFLEYIDRLLAIIEEYDVEALAYINSDWIAHDWPYHWGDSRVEADPEVKAYWMERVVNNPDFIHYDGETSPEEPEQEAPEAVTRLEAVVGDGEVVLSWNASEGATEYIIKGDDQVQSITDTTYTFTGLKNKQEYTFEVIAKNEVGESEAAQVTATPEGDTEEPGDPETTGLTGIYINGEVKTAAVSVDESGMYRLDLIGADGVQSQLVEGSMSDYEGGMAAVDAGRVSSVYFHNVQPGDYVITLKSISDHVNIETAKFYAPSGKEIELKGNGEIPDPEPTAPEAVTGLEAVAGDGEVALSWNASEGATGYSVRGNAKENTVITTAYTFKDLTNDQAYTFEVIAKNEAGESEAVQVTATPEGDEEQPEEPETTGLTGIYANGEVKTAAVSVDESGMYRLDLTGAAGVQSQLIEGSMSDYVGGMAAVDAGRVSSVYFHNVQPGDYIIKLKSISDHVNIETAKFYAPSGKEVELKDEGQIPPVEPTAPEPITGLRATAGDGQVKLSWGASEGATAYVVKGNNEVETVTTTTYTFKGLTNDQEYTFEVIAKNEAGESEAVQIKAIPEEAGEPPVVEPTDGIKLFVGQDNESINGYVDSGKFPEPMGITLYTSLYDMAGVNANGDWGAGRTNMKEAIADHANQDLAIGLSIVEEPSKDSNGLTNIVNGKYDGNLDELAALAESMGDREIYLRIGYEFDGPWNNYAPDKYIPAYRYIKDYLDAAGATNINYVWQACTYVYNLNMQPLMNWYPGDDYIDYVGLSFFFYAEGPKDGSNNSPFLDEALEIARSKGKPVMMAEVSAQYYQFDQNTYHWGNGTYLPTNTGIQMTAEGVWEQYFADQLIQFIDKNEDVIEVVAWINADWDSQPKWAPPYKEGYWGDTRIEVNDYITEKWNEELAKDRWATMGSGEPGNPEPEPTVPKAVTGLSAVENDGEIQLSWNAAEGATAYVVRGNDEVKTTTETTYTFDKLTNGKAYTFEVVAKNEVGASEPVTITATPVEDDTTTPPPGDKVEGKFTPKEGKTLLAIGQDLQSLAGYREGGMPEPGAAVAYISFYNMLKDEYGINYGALGMDNNGVFTNKDTDWGAGPLNAQKTADGWDESALIMALSITEHWDQGGLVGIANGQYDANIKKLADFCKKFPDKKIYLRIGYEFDSRWNSQDITGFGTSNPSPNSGGYHKTEEYKAAYRHIVDGMRAEGVENVAYVWQSSSSPVDDVVDAWFGNNGNINTPKEDIADWYPGDDYVDWVGLSWFLSEDELKNTFNFPDEIACQEELAQDVVDFARAKNKPVMLCEATPQGYDLEISEYDPTPSLVSRAMVGFTCEGANTLFTEGQAAAETEYAAGTWVRNMSGEEAWDVWFVPYFDFIKANEDIIRAVTYINADWNSQYKWAYNQEVDGYVEGYWGDTRIEANPAIKQKWLNETNDSSFWLLGSEDITEQLSE